VVGRINWQYFPKTDRIPNHMLEIVRIFEKNRSSIDSSAKKLVSNDVLSIIHKDLEALGFKVETGKKTGEKNRVPVLFGKNGLVEKSFDADAHNVKTGTVVEVEAGRGVTNYQFLKDLFQACVMYDVKYLAIAIRNTYRGRKDFDIVISFFEAFYASGRLKLPLEGVLIIGY